MSNHISNMSTRNTNADTAASGAFESALARGKERSKREATQGSFKGVLVMNGDWPVGTVPSHESIASRFVVRHFRAAPAQRPARSPAFAHNQMSTRLTNADAASYKRRAEDTAAQARDVIATFGSSYLESMPCVAEVLRDDDSTYESTYESAVAEIQQVCSTSVGVAQYVLSMLRHCREFVEPLSTCKR